MGALPSPPWLPNTFYPIEFAYNPATLAQFINGSNYATSVSGSALAAIGLFLNRTPQEAAAALACPLIFNPNYAQVMATPNVAVYDQLRVIPDGTGRLAPLNVRSGAAAGGVNWEWYGCVNPYNNSGSGKPPVTVLNIKSGLYTGSGSASSVATGFDMTGACAAVWVIPISGNRGGGGYRHTGMTGTWDMIDGNAGTMTGGITLTNSGFNVGTGDGNGNRLTQNGIEYAWVAISNPSADVMAVGQYTGNGTGQTINVGFATPALPTHIWIRGSNIAYASKADFPSGNAVELSRTTVPASVTNLITAITPPPTPNPTNLPGSFTVGSANSVNQGPGAGTRTFYWMALNAANSLVAKAFASGAVSGTGSDVVVTPPFTPGFTCAKDLQASGNPGCWRAQNSHGTTNSTGFGTASDGLSADFVNSGGIDAITSTTFSIGTFDAPSGKTSVWFSFANAGSSGSGGPSGPLSLGCTGALIQGAVNFPYYASLSAGGGSGPYIYTLMAGGLPPGLLMDPTTGVITGTPTTAGAFAFTVQVVDSTLALSTVSTITCAITINASLGSIIAGGTGSCTQDLPN